MDVSVPCILYFDDYHDIDYFGDKAKELIPKLKWEELEYIEGLGYPGYPAIFFIKKNTAYRNLKKR